MRYSNEKKNYQAQISSNWRENKAMSILKLMATYSDLHVQQAELISRLRRNVNSLAEKNNELMRQVHYLATRLQQYPPLRVPTETRPQAEKEKEEEDISIPDRIEIEQDTPEKEPSLPAQQLFTPEATPEREIGPSRRIHPTLAALLVEKKRKEQKLLSPPDHTPPERCETPVPSPLVVPTDGHYSPPTRIQVTAIPGNDNRVKEMLTEGKAWNRRSEGRKYMLREWAWFKYSDKQAILIVLVLTEVLEIEECEDRRNNLLEWERRCQEVRERKNDKGKGKMLGW